VRAARLGLPTSELIIIERLELKMSETIFKLTEDELSLLPSQEDIASYHQRGWYLSKKLFMDEEIEVLERASEHFYQNGPDRPLPLHPPKIAYWHKTDGDKQRHNDYIAYENEAIGKILSKPLIGAVAALLSGSRGIRIFQSTLILKPPKINESTNIVPWHFDKHYWCTCSSQEMLTAFIPFHDCFEENGTITMVDKSNHWREVPHDASVNKHFALRDKSELEELLRINAEYNGQEINKIPMNIKKGHMSFHHCRVYHGSGGNYAATPRRAISLHLQPEYNHWVESYNANGSLNTYNHDYLVRKDSQGHPDYADPEFCPVVWMSEK
jgi:hypothetical protein